MYSMKTTWKGDMAFEADLEGQKVLMDASKDSGGQDSGPRPKPLLLAALTGCSGMDVISILKKMREPCTWFELKVDAESSQDHPKRYTTIKLTYQFKKSDNLNPGNVEKACQLSQEKYCGVNAMLRDAAVVEWAIECL